VGSNITYFAEEALHSREKPAKKAWTILLRHWIRRLVASRVEPPHLHQQKRYCTRERLAGPPVDAP